MSDDGTMSSVSYEDVEFRVPVVEPQSRWVDSTGQSVPEPEEAPDVVYIAEYMGIGDRVTDMKRSDEPLDLTANASDSRQPGGPKKKQPVIEIITRIPTSTRRPPIRRQDSFSDDGGRYPRRQARNRIEIINSDALKSTRMVINSQHLKNALAAVVSYYPGVDFLNKRVSIAAPYQVLVHHMKELEVYKQNQPKTHDSEYAETTAKHIDILISFLEKTMGEDIEKEERRWANKTPTATFEYYWLLLKPGQVIYVEENGHYSPYVVSRATIMYRGPDMMRARYMVDCWNAEYSEGRLQRTMWSFDVFSFEGEQAIHTMPVVPARFFRSESEPITQKQIRLGRIYWELLKRPTYKEYDGAMIGKNGHPSGQLTGRVIVDAEGYGRHNDPDYQRRHRRSLYRRKIRDDAIPKDQLPQFKPHCPCDTCKAATPEAEEGPFANLESLDPAEDELPDNPLFLEVISDTIPAFVLSRRDWSILKVEDLKEVKCDREAFKHLVLDDEVKLTVKALIGKFASTDGKVSPWPNDIVKNKGEGRIFLLHGSPGVGKTCTAECVAELTHRPLLSLTSGDISTSMTARSVEDNLEYFLELGERYGALVLLDEADVYLEQRRARDLRRNGLVSVFLRALEYYKGVLFLTTNRVEAFDGAFTSRIHVALHYRRLTDADRRRVWTNNFERLERDSGGRCRVPVSSREFVFSSPEVRRLELNGREIRNALQTAVALAETEALEDGVESVSITEDHLRAVAKMSKGFKDFLRKQKGKNDRCDGGDSEEEEDEDGGVEGDNLSISSGDSDILSD